MLIYCELPEMAWEMRMSGWGTETLTPNKRLAACCRVSLPCYSGLGGVPDFSPCATTFACCGCVCCQPLVIPIRSTWVLLTLSHYHPIYCNSVILSCSFLFDLWHILLPVSRYSSLYFTFGDVYLSSPLSLLCIHNENRDKLCELPPAPLSCHSEFSNIHRAKQWQFLI